MTYKTEMQYGDQVTIAGMEGYFIFTRLGFVRPTEIPVYNPKQYVMDEKKDKKKKHLTTLLHRAKAQKNKHLVQDLEKAILNIPYES